MSKRGRPTRYTQKLADEICRRLVDGGSLRSVCEKDDMPHRDTVRDWVINDRKGFSDQYTRARQMQALEWGEEILGIADDGTNDTYVDEKGNVRTDADVLGRSRLRVDTRKWLLSKVLPKVYGDKQTHEVTGADGAPLEVNVTRTIVRPDSERKP